MKEKAIVEMRKTLAEIKSSPAFKLSGRNAYAAEWWEKWFEIAMPPSLDAVSSLIKLVTNYETRTSQ
jgi:hypothetical protein